MSLPADPFTRSRAVAVLREAIGDAIERCACLPNEEAARIATVFGCSARTVYRHARRVVAGRGQAAARGEAATQGEAAEAGADAGNEHGVGNEGRAGDRTVDDGQPPTFLDLLEAGAGFVPDQLFWDLYYLCGGNMVRAKYEVERLGYALPSLPTLSRIKRQLPPLVQDGARHGLLNRNRLVLHVRHSAAIPNEAWQVDELTFDIDVLAPGVHREVGADTGTEANGADEEVASAAGDGEPAEADKPRTIQSRLVIFEDDYSRFIPAWSVLPGAVNSAEFLATMAAGIEVRPAEDTSDHLIGGAPDTLVFDNAQAFRSFLVADCLTQMPTGGAPTPAYTPTAKGKVERVIKTIQEWVITGLPGIRSNATRLDGSDIMGLDTGFFLEFDEFADIVRQVIHYYNYTHVHESIGCAPIERYRTSGTQGRAMSDADLAALWLPVHRDTGRRKVHATGVKVSFGETYFYQAPELANLVDPSGRKVTVQVRAQLCNTDRVAVFSGNDRDGYTKFVCFAKKSTLCTEEECTNIALTGVEQARAVSATYRRVRRALEQHSEDIATGNDRGLVAALVASTTAAITPVAVEERAEGAGPAALSGGAVGAEARRHGRRPATRRAAKATKHSAPLPSSTRTKTAKDAALLAVAKDAMAHHDAAVTNGTRPSRKTKAKASTVRSRTRKAPGKASAAKRQPKRSAKGSR